MSDFKVTPEVELNTAQMLERYQLQDETTLRRWAKLHGINSTRGFFYPSEVDLMGFMKMLRLRMVKAVLSIEMVSQLKSENLPKNWVVS